MAENSYKTDQPGFVYILTNPSLESIKIGWSIYSPEKRARELSTTGIPLPYKVCYGLLCHEAEAVEKSVHKLLNNHRVTKNREFFCTNIEDAIKTIELEAGPRCIEVGQWTDDWSREAVDMLKSDLSIEARTTAEANAAAEAQAAEQREMKEAQARQQKEDEDARRRWASQPTGYSQNQVRTRKLYETTAKPQPKRAQMEETNMRIMRRQIEENKRQRTNWSEQNEARALELRRASPPRQRKLEQGKSKSTVVQRLLKTLKK